MVAYFFIGVALLLSLLLLAQGVATADPRVLVKGVRYGGGAVALGLALYLIVSGRWPYAMAAITIAWPFFMRWRALRDYLRTSAGPSQPRRSEVETAMLRMTLDHETGEMFGTVLKGSAAGRSLTSFTLSELLALIETCRSEDPPSIPLLESYLDRRFGPDWRASAAAAGSSEGAKGDTRGRRKPSSAMTRKEALEILGLKEGATADQIKEAYRRLMTKLHPDAGGSSYLAIKLNQAKDLLLGN